MRTSRLYVDTPLASGNRVRLEGERAHYVARVLRLKQGAELTVFDGRGGEFDARVESNGRDAMVLEVGGHRALERESPLAVRLVQGIGRGERMDYVVRRSVELGVSEIQPVLTERVVVRLSGARADRRIAHWRGIAVDACEQCGRNRIPGIGAVATLQAWLSASTPAGLRLFPDPGSAVRLASLDKPDSVTLVVGPEGGFAPRERTALRDAGYVPVSLGPRILRTETAAITALGAVQLLWGDI